MRAWNIDPSKPLPVWHRGQQSNGSQVVLLHPPSDVKTPAAESRLPISTPVPRVAPFTPCLVSLSGVFLKLHEWLWKVPRQLPLLVGFCGPLD